MHRLGEELIGALPDPAVAKGHPRHSPPLVAVTAGIDRLLEQRNTRLVPQFVAQQDRRIRRYRERKRRRELRRVVAGRESLGVYPQVNLERRIGTLDATVFELGFQRLLTIDTDVDAFLANPADPGAERVKSRQIGHPARM